MSWIMGAALEKPVTDKVTKVGRGNNLHFGVSCMQGWRTEMEDTHILAPALWPLPPDNPLCSYISVFAVFDGHGGECTARYAQNNLLRVLVDQKEFQCYASLPAQSLRDHPIGVDMLKMAITMAFIKLDEIIKQSFAKKQAKAATDVNADETPKVVDSGCTACVVLITPKHILCAFCGDSRAMMRTGGRAVPLSFDHKPHHPKERDRIEAAGGYVSMKRVDGELAVSRGFGDFRYKKNVDLPPDLQKISCLPDFVVLGRDAIEDEFVILACDGIWDVISVEECSDLIQSMFDDGERNLGMVCEEMLDTCLEKDSKDNMTCIAVALPGIQLGEGGEGVEGRRAERQIEIKAEERRVLELDQETWLETERLKGEANEARRKLMRREARYLNESVVDDSLEESYHSDFYWLW